MFGIGMHEMIVILIIALIVIGPKQLPEVARMLGKGMAVLRKARDELTEELRESVDLERHVSRLRWDLEKYIEEEKQSMNQSTGENSKAPTAQPGHSPVQQQQEAEKPDEQGVSEERSTSYDKEPLAVRETEHSSTDDAGKDHEGAESVQRESPKEGSHG